MSKCGTPKPNVHHFFLDRGSKNKFACKFSASSLGKHGFQRPSKSQEIEKSVFYIFSKTMLSRVKVDFDEPQFFDNFLGVTEATFVDSRMHRF